MKMTNYNPIPSVRNNLFGLVSELRAVTEWKKGENIYIGCGKTIVLKLRSQIQAFSI